MSKMRQTNIKWIPEISEDFPIGFVKQYFNISKDLAYEGEPERVLKLARSGIVEKDVTTNEGQMAASYEGYNKVEIGDLLLNPMDLYSGANCNVSELKGVISPAYSNLRAKDKNNTCSKYYDYFFKTQYWTMAMFAHGKGVSFDNRWTLNNDSLKSYEIPVPPYEKQKAIVDAIESKTTKIDALISIEEKQIEKLKAYKLALITETVSKGLDMTVKMKDSGIEWIGEIPEGWEVRKFKNMGTFINGYSFPSSDFQNKGIKVVKITNIQPMKMNFDDISYVSENYLKLKNLIIPKGALVFALTRPIIKEGIKVAIFKSDETMLLNQRNAMFVGNNQISTKWQYYLMLNSKFVEQFELCIDKTGQQPNISTYSIMNLFIMVPPRDVQEKITAYLDKKCLQISQLITLKESKIEKLNIYKKSLIYEYVTGKKEA